jgi:hypothetical protein
VQSTVAEQSRYQSATYYNKTEPDLCGDTRMVLVVQPGAWVRDGFDVASKRFRLRSLSHRWILSHLFSETALYNSRLKSLDDWIRAGTSNVITQDTLDPRSSFIRVDYRAKALFSSTWDIDNQHLFFWKQMLFVIADFLLVLFVVCGGQALV